MCAEGDPSQEPRVPPPPLLPHCTGCLTTDCFPAGSSVTVPHTGLVSGRATAQLGNSATTLLTPLPGKTGVPAPCNPGKAPLKESLTYKVCNKPSRSHFPRARLAETEQGCAKGVRPRATPLGFPSRLQPSPRGHAQGSDLPAGKRFKRPTESRREGIWLGHRWLAEFPPEPPAKTGQPDPLAKSEMHCPGDAKREG